MADADPFAQYVAPEPSAAPGGDPFAQYVAPEPAPAAAPEPSLVDKAKGAARAVGQSFSDFGRGLWDTAKSANNAVVGAISHPIDTARAIAANPGAYAREGLRGVNDNIPFANKLVSKIGGIPESSPEDAAAAPGVRAVGNVAGLPLADMTGTLAGKAVEAAPAAARAVGEGAQNRQVARAKEAMELQAAKRTRAGLQTGPVEDAIRENPALRRAAGNDAKVAQVAEQMHASAGKQLEQIYAAHKDVGDIGEAISRMDARIAELQKGTSSDAAVAKQLQGIRDELNDRMGAREAISAKELRAEQSDYQKKGYGKSMPGDEAASARIAANREASKAVGDAVLKQITGLDYAGAKAAAAADPNGIAARILKANDQITAANRIEAAIADRAGRVQPREGLSGKLLEAAKEIRHSPTGYLLSKVPQAAAAGLNAGDNLLARVAGDRAPPRPGSIPAAPPAAANMARVATEWGGAGGTEPTPTANPAKVARLIQMARAGAGRDQLQAQAEADGTPPELAANIAQQFGR